MPIPYFAMVAAQIGFIIHAARTGRPWYWITIILFIPAFGILAYIVFELLPGVARSPTAHRSAGQAKRLIDPEGDYRALARTLELTPTVLNRRALADECVRLGRYDEAKELYREALTGMHATDPYIMQGLAGAQFLAGDPTACLATLDEIKAANPDFQDADAHMLYARSLEALARNDEALAEYQKLSAYFGGEEPRVRRALLLRKTGHTEEAQGEFAEVKRSVERSPSFYRRNQREWYRIAQQNLRA
jgi:hypothetical protein